MSTGGVAENESISPSRSLHTHTFIRTPVSLIPRTHTYIHQTNLEVLDLDVRPVLQQDEGLLHRAQLREVHEWGGACYCNVLGGEKG